MQSFVSRREVRRSLRQSFKKLFEREIYPIHETELVCKLCINNDYLFRFGCKIVSCVASCFTFVWTESHWVNSQMIKYATILQLRGTEEIFHLHSLSRFEKEVNVGCFITTLGSFINHCLV